MLKYIENMPMDFEGLYDKELFYIEKKAQSDKKGTPTETYSYYLKSYLPMATFYPSIKRGFYRKYLAKYPRFDDLNLVANMLTGGVPDPMFKL